MGIVDKVQTEQAQAAKTAAGRYVELIETNSDDASSVKELHDLMGKLGKSAADAQHDAGILSTARTLKQRISESAGVAKRFNDVAAAARKHPEQTMEIMAQRKTELEQLQSQEAKLKGEYDAATDNVRKLNELKAQHPELISHLKPATYADLD